MGYLLQKYKVEQTEVISRLLSSLFIINYKNVGQIEHIHFPNTFSYLFHTYDITSLGNIHPITCWKYTKHPIIAFYKAFVKLL